MQLLDPVRQVLLVVGTMEFPSDSWCVCVCILSENDMKSVVNGALKPLELTIYIYIYAHVYIFTADVLEKDQILVQI